MKLVMEDAEGNVETPWAEPVGDNLFRLDNSPFFLYGVSADDVVEGEPEAPDRFRFIRVVHPSGNCTLRIFFKEPWKDSEIAPLLAGIQDRGCSYEGAFGKLLAINVPPGVDLGSVTQFLTDLGLTWEYANPTYDQLFGGAKD